jgi:hypothetical protein
LNGGDGELVCMNGWNASADDASVRIDSTEYAWAHHWGNGYTDLGGGVGRAVEDFTSHMTPGNGVIGPTLWHPYSQILGNADTERPSVGFTWKVTPTLIGFSINKTGIGIFGGNNGNGDLALFGTGTIYLSGTQGYLVNEGATKADGNQIIEAVDDPSHGQRFISKPNVVGDSRYVVSAQSANDGPAAWAKATIACSTACVNLLGSSGACTDSIPMDGTNTPLGNCSSTTGLRLCECH